MLKSILISVLISLCSYAKSLWQALLDRPDEWTAEQALQLGNSLSSAFGYEMPAIGRPAPHPSNPNSR